MAASVQLSAYRNSRTSAFFSRVELGLILSAYSRRVADGVFRDYAIDQGGSSACFVFFRHASERPLFTVVKTLQHGRIAYTLMEGEKRRNRSDSLSEVLSDLPKAESQLLG